MEFEAKDRHPDWVWTAGLVFGIAATISIFYDNLFFGIFLVVAGILIIMGAIRAPKQLTISIEEKMIRVNDDTIVYERVKRFWIDETAKPDKLLLLVRGGLSPVMAFSLEGVTAEAVRTALSAKEIPEEFIRESTGVKIAERLGL
jgi:uncharacterized membrane protein